MEEINKENLEKLLGYEIQEFSVVPIFIDEILTNFEVKVLKKQSVEYIEVKTTILKTGEIKDGGFTDEM